MKMYRAMGLNSYRSISDSPKRIGESPLCAFANPVDIRETMPVQALGAPPLSPL
jgi:hypothetical protein